jgi:hypothetical protein
VCWASCAAQRMTTAPASAVSTVSVPEIMWAPCWNLV